MTFNISYRVSIESDRSELKKLFEEYYYPYEPVNTGWIDVDPVPEDMTLTLKALGDGTSLVAVDDVKNIIVGACITGVVDGTSKQALLNEANRTTNRKWAQYLQLYARLDSEANFYQRFNVQKLFHVGGLTVNVDYRGRSIATKLVQKSIEIAAGLGFEICTIYCSSFYTEQIALNLKMDFVSELAMDDIKDEKNELLIHSYSPHTHIKTYAKRL